MVVSGVTTYYYTNYSSATVKIVVTKHSNIGGLGSVDTANASNLLVAYLVIASLGILGNGLQLIVFAWRNRRHHSSPGFPTDTVPRSKSLEWLLCNQTVCDLFTGILLLVTTCLQTWDILSTTSDIWWWNDLVCRLFVTQMPLTLVNTVATYNLTIITLYVHEQLLGSTACRVRISHVSIRYYIAIGWLLGTAVTSLFTIPTSGLDDSGRCDELGRFSSDAAREFTGLLMVTLSALLPFTLIGYALIHVFLRLPSLRQRFNTSSHARHASLQAFKHQIAELKAVVMHDVTLILCSAMNSVMVLLTFFVVVEGDDADADGTRGHGNSWLSSLSAASAVLTYCDCAVNPIMLLLWDVWLGLHRRSSRQERHGLDPSTPSPSSVQCHRRCSYGNHVHRISTTSVSTIEDRVSRVKVEVTTDDAAMATMHGARTTTLALHEFDASTGLHITQKHLLWKHSTV